MKWSTVTAFTTMTRRADGMRLLMYVSEAGGQWAIAAFEAPFDPEMRGQPLETVMARVFDNHAHAVIKPERSMVKAMAKAEKYARWWRRTGATAAPCPCEVIEAAE